MKLSPSDPMQTGATFAGDSTLGRVRKAHREFMRGERGLTPNVLTIHPVPLRKLMEDVGAVTLQPILGEMKTFMGMRIVTSFDVDDFFIAYAKSFH